MREAVDAERRAKGPLPAVELDCPVWNSHFFAEDQYRRILN